MQRNMQRLTNVQVVDNQHANESADQASLPTARFLELPLRNSSAALSFAKPVRLPEMSLNELTAHNKTIVSAHSIVLLNTLFINCWAAGHAQTYGLMQMH